MLAQVQVGVLFPFLSIISAEELVNLRQQQGAIRDG
jgi:hypothetical protein